MISNGGDRGVDAWSQESARFRSALRVLHDASPLALLGFLIHA